MKCNWRDVLSTHDDGMPYTVTITPTSGEKVTYARGGASDHEALLYAGKIVEADIAAADPSSSVVI